ncbi:MAG: enoyl-CoA hydratase-related protein [Pseudomonadota bacterium]
MAETVGIEDHGDHLTVFIDNPAKLNTLTLDYHQAQHAALDQAAREDRITSVIMTGRGGYFSAGGDLSLLKGAVDGGPAERTQLVSSLQASIRAIRTCPKPVIAAVDGGAAGGGLSTMLACDLIVADAGASFLAAHVKIGATVDGGLSWFLARALPHALASELCLFGRPVDAETLLRHGVINQVVEKDTAEPAAQKLAAKLARGPAETQAAMKALMVAAKANTLEAQLDFEQETLVSILGSVGPKEGVAAFLEKRRPDFPAAEGRSIAPSMRS